MPFKRRSGSNTDEGRRKINGEWFYMRSGPHSKATAKKQAESFRQRGFKSRVVDLTAGYYVYSN